MVKKKGFGVSTRENGKGKGTTEGNERSGEEDWGKYGGETLKILDGRLGGNKS